MLTICYCLWMLLLLQPSQWCRLFPEYGTKGKVWAAWIKCSTLKLYYHYYWPHTGCKHNTEIKLILLICVNGCYLHISTRKVNTAFIWGHVSVSLAARFSTLFTNRSSLLYLSAVWSRAGSVQFTENSCLLLQETRLMRVKFVGRKAKIIC